jgi:hypothetical protein
MTYFLKVAKKEDFESFLPLVKELYDYTVYSSVVDFNEDTMRERFENSLEDLNQSCTVLLKADEVLAGFFSMTASPLLCSDETLAVELGFWIKPEYRNKETIRLLIKSFRTWAKLAGCKGVLMAKIKHKTAPEQYVCRRIK